MDALRHLAHILDEQSALLQQQLDAMVSKSARTYNNYSEDNTEAVIAKYKAILGQLKLLRTYLPEL